MMKKVLVIKIKRDDLPCEDVTYKWLTEQKNEEGTCENQNFFVDKNNVKHDVDGVKVILDRSKNEESIAKFYAKLKQINIKMLPRLLSPKDVKSGDFIEETSGIIWEIKEPTGNIPGTTILNQIKGQKEKAHHFIIDMHNSNMDIDVAVKEIESILSNNRYNWVENVILMKDKQIKKVFIRKK